MYPIRISSFLGIFLLVMLGRTPWVYSQNDSGLAIRTQSLQQCKVLMNGQEIAIFHGGDALDKSYIHPLWTPDRHCVTYDSPADHIHHRALCVGWPDVSGTDFWAEIFAPQGKRGVIHPLQLDQEKMPDGSVRITERNQWLQEDGTQLVQGRHAWTFLPPQGNVQCVDVELDLTATVPEVVFGSDAGAPREYHGLTLRIGPLEAIRYYNSEGTEGGQNCKGQAARWCAARGTQHGAPVTVAILDHPSNDSHPTRFYIQDQGMQFISSSPNFGKPRIVKQGETWHLRYRVIAAGKPSTDSGWDVDALWRDYTGSPMK